MEDEKPPENPCRVHIPYKPYLLPDWVNECESEHARRNNIIAQLTDENVGQYDEMIAHVGWKKRINYAIEHLDDKPITDNHIRKLNCLLANVISVVIMYARNKESVVPDDYLLNTYLYLRKVRDEFGEYPPNIEAFVEMVKSKAKENVLKIMDNIDNTEIDKLPANLYVRRFPREKKDKADKPPQSSPPEATE